ncbi:LITAF-like zinc ribbon domain-containing protein [Aspergillus caelatus]|uniref:LITAF-like zinc ribbon domain-containing protein n=1 Tax=Aspergillus caelatus TaxID=61420 RepID=A0A5N7APJ7_9EURO|nr:LITAF-like zinc ribbon domain-containing protein [Aspergillus caelatus]KAE8370929.1 LITAF-like zinc ribbon domain-containing protein [Aspergillus caelatus]
MEKVPSTPVPVYEQQPQFYQPQPIAPPNAHVQSPVHDPNMMAAPQPYVHPAGGHPSGYNAATPLHALQRGPTPVDCPICGVREMTRTEAESGNTTHGWAAVICCCFCLGCIPYLMSSLKDYNHYCEQLERTVGALLERLGEDSSSIMPSRERPDNSGHFSQKSAASTTAKPDYPSAPPVMVIRDLASDVGVKSPDASSNESVLDGLISTDLAIDLMTIFLEHYGRWVLFDPESDPKALLGKVNRSPLLFSACCLIAVRHTTESLATTLAPKLYQSARSLISTALLVSPQPIEFFQAAIVLSLWSTTVGQVPLSIDSWLLSGFALQHCQSSPLFDAVNTTNPHAELMKTVLDNWCIWNHLCLAHLQYCVGTSRKSMIHASQIPRCRAIVGSDHATNYELRMVAEIHLYWTLYERTSSESIDLLKSIASLQDWKKEWQFILEQPRAQFLLMGFHFAHLLLYDQCLKCKTARARESVISEMIRHSTAIIRLAMDTTDDRTRHLTDHIYHMITFAAIIICRLLNAYEEQLVQIYNLDELDSLILSLIHWMQTIGLPCHAAYTLGHVIGKVHQKLRPAVVSQPLPPEQSEIFFGQDLASYFPEFLGVETTEDGNWDLLPSWGFSSPP